MRRPSDGSRITRHTPSTLTTTETFSVRLGLDTKRALEKLAGEQGVTPSTLARHAILDYLDLTRSTQPKKDDKKMNDCSMARIYRMSPTPRYGKKASQEHFSFMQASADAEAAIAALDTIIARCAEAKSLIIKHDEKRRAGKTFVFGPARRQVRDIAQLAHAVLATQEEKGAR